MKLGEQIWYQAAPNRFQQIETSRTSRDAAGLDLELDRE